MRDCIHEARAFARAWCSGDDASIQETARALILAAGRPLPRVDEAEVRDPMLQRIRLHGEIRGLALTIYDSLALARMREVKHGHDAWKVLEDETGLTVDQK